MKALNMLIQTEKQSLFFMLIDEMRIIIYNGNVNLPTEARNDLS